MTTDIFIIVCKYLLYCYKDLIDINYKRSEFNLTYWSYKYQHLQNFVCLLALGHE